VGCWLTRALPHTSEYVAFINLTDDKGQSMLDHAGIKMAVEVLASVPKDPHMLQARAARAHARRPL
jgi:hypothetical protein